MTIYRSNQGWKAGAVLLSALLAVNGLIYITAVRNYVQATNALTFVLLFLLIKALHFGVTSRINVVGRIAWLSLLLIYIAFVAWRFYLFAFGNIED